MTAGILTGSALFLVGALSGLIPGVVFAETLRGWLLPLHGRLVGDYGRHSRIPAPVVAGELVVALPAAQVTAHADAMQRAAEEHLPELPQGQHSYVPAWEVTPEEWRSYVSAGRAVEPVKAAGHAPWTGSQPKLTPEAEAELMRQRRIQEQIDARGPSVTAADLREILDALRQPAFGTDRCEADVLAAGAEAGAQMAEVYRP